mgnify:CR=1 FL=1
MTEVIGHDIDLDIITTLGNNHIRGEALNE